jgi:hypothetical protein
MVFSDCQRNGHIALTIQAASRLKTYLTNEIARENAGRYQRTAVGR